MDAQRLGEGQRKGGLAHAGDVLKQNVSSREDRHQHLGKDFVLADDHRLDLPENFVAFTCHSCAPYRPPRAAEKPL